MWPEIGPTHKTSANACLACRRVKMRCTMTIDAVKCDRCVRKSIDCAFREHRRGRKPGTRIIKGSKRSVDSHMQTPDRAAEFPRSTSHDNRVPDFWTGSIGLQPDNLFSHLAMKGKFSLGNILSTTHGSTFDPPVDSVSPDDPVHVGLVSHERAVFLFERFMTKLNPYVSQLDPHLHSFAYVRQKSSFLLSTVLAAASKCFEPALHSSLNAHTEKLFLEAFRHGDKSTETIQAIMVLTYWKEPNDTRAWMSVGFAIRMAMDLGWHTLGSVTNSAEERTEARQREVRNDERTWLVLFVYDRSMSLQTGKPWMIERSSFIESVQEWASHPQAIANDRLLCSLVTLRLLAAEVFDITNPGCEYPARLLTLLQSRIERWQTKWLERTDSVGCHNFLIRFYGAHQSLQLFAIPLQTILNTSTFDETYDLRPFWISYSSAMKMLRLMPEFSSFLNFCQDSIHVMTAYSAVLLIKLLLSSPPLINQEIETDTISTIHAAANVLAARSSSSSASCKLQSKFLNNILLEYSTIRRSRSTKTSSASVIADRLHGHEQNATLINPFQDSLAPVQSQSPARQPVVTGMIPTTRSFQSQSISSDSDQTFLPLQRPSRPSSAQASFFHRTSQLYSPSTISTQTASNGQPDLEEGLNDQVEEASGFPFSDDATWVGMFANAGFSIQDGVFCDQPT